MSNDECLKCGIRDDGKHVDTDRQIGAAFGISRFHL